jgi:hypothetical protein
MFVCPSGQDEPGALALQASYLFSITAESLKGKDTEEMLRHVSYALCSWP